MFNLQIKRMKAYFFATCGKNQTALLLEYIGKFIPHTTEVIRNELQGHWSDSDRYLELKNSACMIVFQ